MPDTLENLETMADAAESTENELGEVESLKDELGLSSDELAEFGVVEGESKELSEEESQDQPENQESTEDSEELSELDQLKRELGKEESKEENQDSLDTFQLVHNGVQLEKTKEEVTQLAQMGLDYTQKTQVLSQERQDFEQTKEQWTQQFDESLREVENNINELQQWQAYLGSIQSQNPEAYQELFTGFTQYQQQMTNPMVQSAIQAANAQNQELSSRLESLEQQGIRQTFDSQLRELRNYHKNLGEKYGLKMDESKLKEAFIEDVEDKYTLQDHYKRIYGDELIKLAESKAKVATAKKKVGKGSPTVGSMNSSGNVKPRSNVNDMSWSQLENKLVDDPEWFREVVG